MLSKIQEILKDKRYAKPIITVLLLISIIMIYKKRNNTEDISISSAIPIEIAAAKIDNLPVYISAIGTVIPENTVTLKTQVNGQLIKLGFNDGQKVRKGDLLAQIDPRSYQAQLTQYEGQLLKDQAILENSLIDLKRYKDLWKQNAISKQILDTQTALVKQNEGIVQLDQGLVDSAKVSLSYCDILAPFDGQVGISNLSEGSIVQTTDSDGIAVLNSLDPILVFFSVPEVEIPNIISEFNQNPLKVEVYDQALKTLLNTGELSSIDNQVDTSTGTIRLKAEFKNSDYSLFPNQFVNIKLLVRTIKDAVVVPTTAIQHGPSGSFVYLLSDDKTKVTIQPVTVDLTSGSLTVIKEGLLEKQNVAVTGVDKLRNEASVLVSGSKL